jgi:RNA polymerase sigma-70 factor (ECF subfamily)
LDRLRAGDGDAAGKLYQRFATRLIALTRARLDTRLGGKVDLEGVLQSAFKSFFLRQPEGQLEVEDWNDLWSLLVSITLNECGHQVSALHRASGSRHRIQRRRFCTWLGGAGNGASPG